MPLGTSPPPPPSYCYNMSLFDLIKTAVMVETMKAMVTAIVKAIVTAMVKGMMLELLFP